MSKQEWDESEKKNIRDLSALVISFIAGAVVLLPSLSSLISPPYIFGWVLFAFLVTAIVSFALLCITLYLTFTAYAKRPAKLHSNGNLFAIMSFLLITVFLLLNVFKDIDTLPEIEDVTYMPLNFNSGNTLRFSVNAKDSDKDTLSYKWLIDGIQISQDSFAYFKFPNTEEKKIVSIEVSDPDGNSVIKTITISPMSSP